MEKEIPERGPQRGPPRGHASAPAATDGAPLRSPPGREAEPCRGHHLPLPAEAAGGQDSHREGSPGTWELTPPLVPRLFALLARHLPARRAAEVEPAVTLRAGLRYIPSEKKG